jgi:hypothetical protein
MNQCQHISTHGPVHYATLHYSVVQFQSRENMQYVTTDSTGACNTCKWKPRPTVQPSITPTYGPAHPYRIRYVSLLLVPRERSRDTHRPYADLHATNHTTYVTFSYILGPRGSRGTRWLRAGHFSSAFLCSVYACKSTARCVTQWSRQDGCNIMQMEIPAYGPAILCTDLRPQSTHTANNK